MAGLLQAYHGQVGQRDELGVVDGLVRLEKEAIRSVQIRCFSCAESTFSKNANDNPVGDILPEVCMSSVLGLLSIAVPVRDAVGEARAAVALHAPVDRLSLEQAFDHLPCPEQG